MLLLAAVAANLALAAAAWTRQPWANGPAAWRWEYLPAGAGGGFEWSAGGGAAAAAVVAGLAALCIAWWHRRLAAWRGALPLVVAGGVAFTFGLVAAQPGGLARLAAALVSRNGFGYAWDAALAPPAGALLADYPAASAGLGQHSVTHPPGPLLAVRALGVLDRLLPPPAPAAVERAARRLPGGEGEAGATDGGEGLVTLAAAAARREVERARGHGRPVPRPPPGPWAVAALGMLLPALSALAAWPLYLLARLWGCERPAALLAAVLWLLVPARSLFTPSLDQALPLPLVGAAWLAAGGGRWRFGAAGALLFAACFLSYGCLSVLPLVVVCAAVAPPRPRSTGAAGDDDPLAAPGAGEAAGGDPLAAQGAGQAGGRDPLAAAGAGQPGARDWGRWAALAMGFALPYLALAVVAGHDPWHALRAALALHQRIAVATRSYGTWLLWNPYDFALLLSPGVLLLAAAAAAGGRWSLPTDWRYAAWCWWGLLGLLLLSGGVRGEVGRIWLVWMPFACLLAAAAAARSGGVRHGGIGLLLASEAALTLALAARMVFVS